MPHLLTIPPEIRQMIYTYALQDSTIPCRLQGHSSILRWRLDAIYKQSQHHSLLLVCEQIHSEADELYRDLTTIILCKGKPWTKRALDTFLGDDRMKRVYRLKARSPYRLVEHFPRLTNVCCTGYAFCNWEVDVRNYDLIVDGPVEAGLKGVIRERVEAEDGDQHANFIRAMMKSAVANAGIKVLGGIKFEGTSSTGDRASMYKLVFDFSNMSIQHHKRPVKHYRRTTHPDRVCYDVMFGDSETVAEFDVNPYLL